KAAEGQPVKSYAALTSLLRGRKEGDKIVLSVAREGKTIEITVTLEERPLGAYSQGRPSLAALLGVLSEDAEGGVKLTRLLEERPAEKAGLREGDLLKEVDGKPVTAAEQVVELLRHRKDGDKVALKLAREGETKEVTLTLEAPAGGGPGT